MNSDNDIFPHRLRQARLMRGFSLEKLSQSLAVPVSKQAISKYEKGQMKPDSSILIALANALGVKIDYFFRPFTVEVDKVEFRKKSGFTKKMANVVKERVRVELERYLEIEQITGMQVRFTLPRKEVRTRDQAREFAGEIRQILALGNDGISNVIEVLEDHGIKVIELAEDEGFDGLSGFANETIPLIVVNDKFPTERKRFTTLHELGHLLLDMKAEVSPKEIESLNSAFASEMLLLAAVLKSKLETTRYYISLSELADIQHQYGISIDNIMASLQELGVISVNRYNVFQRKKNTVPAFRALVEKSMVELERSGRFARMVYRALADEAITFSKAAVLLNVPIEEVKSNLHLI